MQNVCLLVYASPTRRTPSVTAHQSSKRLRALYVTLFSCRRLAKLSRPPRTGSLLREAGRSPRCPVFRCAKSLVAGIAVCTRVTFVHGARLRRCKIHRTAVVVHKIAVLITTEVGYHGNGGEHDRTSRGFSAAGGRVHLSGCFAQQDRYIEATSHPASTRNTRTHTARAETP